MPSSPEFGSTEVAPELEHDITMTGSHRGISSVDDVYTALPRFCRPVPIGIGIQGVVDFLLVEVALFKFNHLGLVHDMTMDGPHQVIFAIRGGIRVELEGAHPLHGPTVLTVGVFD